MAIEGVDYSSARPDPGCLFSNGKRFAVRYVSIGGHPKNITASEAKKLTAAGLRIPIVFEETAGHMLGGSAAGKVAATNSQAMLKDAGLHERTPIYFALDVDPANFSGSQWSACAEYLKGAASVLGAGRVGIYGNDQAVTKLASYAPWKWQTYAWSEGNWVAGCELQQYHNGVIFCGGEVDFTRALVTNYGQSGYYVRDGVDLRRAQDFARRCDPIPYKMRVEVGWDGIDCSGFMSILINSLLNKSNVWVRLFSTGTIRDAVAAGNLPMLWPGLGDSGDFNIGVTYPWEMSSGIGHTAGTLGGLNVESRGGYGVLIGTDARGATNALFKHHYHVKIDGTFPQEEDDMPTAAEVEQAMENALDAKLPALAREIAHLSGSPHVFVSAGDERGVFVITPVGLVHVDNPTDFAYLSGGKSLGANEGITMVSPEWLTAHLAGEG